MEDLHAVHTEQCWGPSISPLDSRPINQEMLGGEHSTPITQMNLPNKYI